MSALDDAIAGVERCLDVGWCQGKGVQRSTYGDYRPVAYCVVGAICSITSYERNEYAAAVRVVAVTLGLAPYAHQIIRWNDSHERKLGDIKRLYDQLVAQRVPVVGDEHNYTLSE